MEKENRDETIRYWGLRVIKKGLKKYVERILAVEKSRIVDAFSPIL